MTMNDAAMPILSVLAGVALGAIFFGGLWWTVRRALSSRQPALLVMASMLGRTGLVVVGFYFVAGGQWQRLLFCLAGFIAARLIVTRLLPEDDAPRTRLSPGGYRAMRLSPDELIFWQSGFVQLNATIVFTWVLMAVLALGSMLVTRRLSTGEERSRLAESAGNARHRDQKQIADIGLAHPLKYLPFLGTLFLFVAASSLSSIIPMFEPPTGSLSTTVALALCVFVAVPLYGIEARGSAAISNPMSSRPSSCCRSTSSARPRARWRSRFACSAT